MHYTEAELKAVLGEPTRAGHFPGDGSFGTIKPWWPQHGPSDIPAGPNRYMFWDCHENNGEGECCVAVSIAKNRAPEDSWQVVSLCRRHAELVELSPVALEDLHSFKSFASNEYRPQPAYEVKVIDSTSYLGKKGPEWDALTKRLGEGYEFVVVAANHRIPGFHIVVLRRADVEA